MTDSNDLVQRLESPIDSWRDPDCKEAAAEIRRLNARITELEAENKALKEALEPSSKTKAVYIGEFKFTTNFIDDNGFEQPREVYVPWTTIKEIMKAISAHASPQEKMK